MEADDPDSESLGRPDSHTVRSSLVHAQQLTGRQMSRQECMMASVEGGQSHEAISLSPSLFSALCSPRARCYTDLLLSETHQQIHKQQIMDRLRVLFSLLWMSELDASASAVGKN
jgi:hypothetical protein